MRYLDTWVRVHRESPLGDFSSRYPEAEMTLWLSALVDLLQVQIPVYYDVERVIDSAWEMLLYSEEFHDENSALFLLTHPFAEPDDSVVAIASAFGCMLIPPVSLHSGWETHRVICREQDQLRDLVDAVSGRGEVELLSQRVREHNELVKDVYVVPAHFMEGLTNKQVNVLLSSYEQGLFDVPAKVKMDKVAERTGLSRSTFGEHLRKGELQIMRNLYPFLKLRRYREEEGSGAAPGQHGTGGGD